MNLRHPASMAPKAQALTDLLINPAPTPENLDGGLHRALASRLAAAAPGRIHGPLKFDAWLVHTASAEHLGTSRCFQWTPRNSRRLLGVAGARRVLAGTSSSPLAGVRAAIDEAVTRGSSIGARPGSLGTWLAEAPRGVLGAIVAEAGSHATDLLVALRWEQLGPKAVLGAADPIWAVPGAPWISVRGRRDAVVLLDPEARTRALLCVRAGKPGQGTYDDLSLVALADALTQRESPIPTRVVGHWPSCGRSLSLEVAPEDLRHAARLLVGAAEKLRQGRDEQQAA